MPFPIKLGLSIVVILVALGAFSFQHSLGHVGPKYATLFLGVFMVIAMWIFPEVSRKETAGGIRSGKG
jgi:protein-S-isoprenylcysteine O-methyltransferase Ste14